MASWRGGRRRTVRAIPALASVLAGRHRRGRLRHGYHRREGRVRWGRLRELHLVCRLFGHRVRRPDDRLC
jgi:hypothetical protein